MDIVWKYPLTKTNSICCRISYVSKKLNGDFMLYFLTAIGFMEYISYFQRIQILIL